MKWDIPSDLPPVAVAPHRLTQAVLNPGFRTRGRDPGGTWVTSKPRRAADRVHQDRRQSAA